MWTGLTAVRRVGLRLVERASGCVAEALNALAQGRRSRRTSRFAGLVGTITLALLVASSGTSEAQGVADTPTPRPTASATATPRPPTPTPAPTWGWGTPTPGPTSTPTSERCCCVGARCSPWAEGDPCMGVVGPCVTPTPTPTTTPTATRTPAYSPTPTPTFRPPGATPPPLPFPLNDYKDYVIQWRPEIGVPPLNYCESPGCTQLANGDWICTFHGGNCCVTGNNAFEAIFQVRYYACGATPRWQMVRSSQDIADGHEYGGATDLQLISGKWRMQQSGTRKSDWGKPNRLRGGMGFSPSLWDGPWDWWDDIFRPLDPACEPIGTCSGIGAPQNGALVWIPQYKQLWLYGQDSTHRPPMRVIRYPLDPHTGYRIGPPELTEWPQVSVNAATAGQLRAQAEKIRLGTLHPLEQRVLAEANGATVTLNDPNVTDIGTGQDGCLYALASDRGTASANSYYGGVTAYRSCPTPLEAPGRVWQLYSFPAWQPVAGVAWDAGWVRDERGIIVEPRAIIAVYATSPHFANEGDGWWLIVRTEPLAYRPSTLTQTPVQRDAP